MAVKDWTGVDQANANLDNAIEDLKIADQQVSDAEDAVSAAEQALADAQAALNAANAIYEAQNSSTENALDAYIGELDTVGVKNPPSTPPEPAAARVAEINQIRSRRR